MGSRATEERSVEALRFYFEFFKHFTTLATAAALIVLGISEALNVGFEPPIWALLVWMFTLSQSLIGMVGILGQIASANPTFLKPGPKPRIIRSLEQIHLPNPQPRDPTDPFRPPGLWLYIVMINTVMSFFAGILMFLITLTNAY